MQRTRPTDRPLCRSLKPRCCSRPSRQLLIVLFPCLCFLTLVPVLSASLVSPIISAVVAVSAQQPLWVAVVYLIDLLPFFAPPLLPVEYLCFLARLWTRDSTGQPPNNLPPPDRWTSTLHRGGHGLPSLLNFKLEQNTSPGVISEPHVLDVLCRCCSPPLSIPAFC